MKTFRIVLTNDDGVDSPALLPTIESILALRDPPYNLQVELEVVSPATQQSWIAKKISIREKLKINRQYSLDGYDHPITTITGTPADCVNYAIYKDKQKPDLVVSGMNDGSNTSIGHHYSSGTVAGAIEAVIAGVQAIAISAPYAKEKRTPKMFSNALEIFPKILYRFLTEPPTGIRMLSINIPLTRKSNYFLPVFLEPKTYQAIFQETEEGILQHRPMSNLAHPSDLTKGSDRWARALGIPTALPIDTQCIPVAPATLGRWLAKHNLIHIFDENDLNDLDIAHYLK